MEAMTTACERQRRGRVHYFQGVEDGLEEVRGTWGGGSSSWDCCGWAVWNSLKNYNKIIILIMTEKNVVSTLKFLFPTKNNGSAPPIMPFSVLLEPFFQVKVGSFLIFKSANHIYVLCSIVFWRPLGT